MKRHTPAFGSFTRDPAMRKSFLWVVGLWLLSLTSLGIAYSRLPPQVPLFYSLIRGSGQLADKVWLWLLPGLAFVLALIHLWIAKYNFNRDRLLARITSVAAVLVCLLFSVALIHILFIVL